MRWLAWLEMGSCTRLKGFTPFSTAAFDWWVKAGCKAPWLRKEGEGWALGELDFNTSKSGAKELAKIAHEMLKAMIKEKDELPIGFRALLRRLDAEKADKGE